MPRIPRRPLVIAAVLLVAAAWILSGLLTRPGPEPESREEPQPMTVGVAERRAEPVEELLVLQGDVEPDRQMVVRAETSGQVAEWAVPRGARVEEGDLLARLKMDDREAQLRRAEARLAGAKSDYEATKAMAEDNFIGELNVAVKEAELEAARAEVEAVRLDIEHTRIKAPMTGTVNRRIAERGDFLGVGGEVAEIVVNDPLLAVVQVPQHREGDVEPGQEARIRFLDGRRAKGEVTFVAPLADPATRTFRLEATFPNPDGDLPSGISAEVVIPVAERKAHRVSPSLLVLNDDGRLGLRAVEDGEVVFHEVEIVRADEQGVWVTGPPDELTLITVGGGFVRAGETVRTEAAPAPGEGGP
ncbi:RND transporter [Thiohalorhabdus denitrificans]|uniref:Membrane fusion protein, multidrug efflux system n=1 Tax=Thiohalorhabdus denitrificans TaxID=381306 RepID=A0A0P9CCV5_9GAMM|nr:efflux RND transporter periplasmic adaptor subunit [Thiohalorhabdus denitrificans]KPV40713.1 RND transporter [Thiohalorhabdus denitrificans]SCY46237.1 membrane fusion protein, multidrug efflux system [Thiohalorhabdus denitrificans]